MGVGWQSASAGWSERTAWVKETVGQLSGQGEGDPVSAPKTRKQDDPGVPEALPRTLIRVREHFVPEMLKDVEDL